MLNSQCHPSYTAAECARYCERNPGVCNPSREVPEPSVVALLMAALIVGMVAKTWGIWRGRE